MPPPSSAEVAPGALKIMPYHVPRTFTNTNRLLLPITVLPVKLKAVMFVDAAPVVALPAVVFLSTVAAPLDAVAFTLLLIAWLVLLVKLRPVFIVTLGTLLAIS